MNLDFSITCSAEAGSLTVKYPKISLPTGNITEYNKDGSVSPAAAHFSYTDIPDTEQQPGCPGSTQEQSPVITGIYPNRKD